MGRRHTTIEPLMKGREQGGHEDGAGRSVIRRTPADRRSG
jgi:hypothetical protein